MRVLLVDDSKSVRTLLKSFLKEYNWEILEASNGQEALEKLTSSGTIDLCLVDWNMPVMAGIDFVRAARKTNDHKAMWIMMVTTETEMDNVVQAMAAGANEYVMKPFTKDIIVEKLKIMGFVPPG